MEKNIKLLKIFYWICGILIFFGIFIRIYHLTLPVKQVFDEIYFPVMANKILHGELMFDVHPPFGKMIMAIGIHFFGNTQLGWRIVPCLCGLLMIWFFPKVWYTYFKEYRPTETKSGLTIYEGEYESVQRELKVGYWLLAALISIETFFIVYSRIGLMDQVLFAFIFWVFYLSLKPNISWKRMIGIAIVLGLATSIKWIGLGVIVPIGYLFARRGGFKKFIACLPISVLVYCLVVMSFAIYHHHPHPWLELLTWHREAWDYQTTLKAVHPWGSPWYSWPVMLKPLLMYYETVAPNTQQVISAIGNPLIWYGSTLAVIWSVLYIFWRWFVKLQPIADHPLTILLIGYFSFWLPWAAVTRVLFIYHYFPSYGFALLILTYWLMRIWNKSPLLVIILLILAFGLTIYFTPVVTALNISYTSLRHHVWLKGWL